MMSGAMLQCWNCGALRDNAEDGLCPGCRPYLCHHCGNMKERVECYNCEDGYSHHDCGEDCCACVSPEPNQACDICEGHGGWQACPSCQPNAFND